MIKYIKFWWKTQILREVVFDERGDPIDCKGLQIKGGRGEPFEEGTLYCISSEWREYDYLGRGKYMSKRGFALRTDNENPYYKIDVKTAMEAFGKAMKRSGIYG